MSVYNHILMRIRNDPLLETSREDPNICRPHISLKIVSGLACSPVLFFFSSRRRHTRLQGDWSSDVCSSDLNRPPFRCRLFRWLLSQRPRRTGKRWARVCNGWLKKIQRSAVSRTKRQVSSRSEERRVGKKGRTRKWTERITK